MNTKIFVAIIGVGVLVSAGIFFSRDASRNEVAVSADEATGADGGGCPIGGGQCGAASNHEPPTSASAAAGKSTSEQNSTHDFTLEKLGGGTISLAEYRGKKPVIVDFWASWCPNCRRDMPKVNGWYRQYRDQVEVIGVNLQESPSVVEQFVTSNDIVFPIALDPAGVTSAQFGIQFTNTHFLFNKAGELVRVIPGDIKEADIVSLIES